MSDSHGRPSESAQPVLPVEVTKALARASTVLLLLAGLFWGIVFSAEPSYPRRNESVNGMLALAFVGTVSCWCGHLLSSEGFRKLAYALLGLAAAATVAAIVVMIAQWP